MIFTVVICCYNSEKKLSLVLNALLHQNTHGFLTYEVIVIDNNSNDDTQKIIFSFVSSYSKELNLRSYKETKQGLINARRLGVQKSNGIYICFCDDDNLLNNNYLYNAYLIFNLNHEIGILGGWSEGIFESQPPNWFEKYSTSYAVGGRPSEDLVFGDYVWGAGMCIRKRLAVKIFEDNFLNIGRSASNLTAGDDIEICLKVKVLNYKIAQSLNLKFRHIIYDSRLTIKYFLKLNEGFGFTWGSSIKVNTRSRIILLFIILKNIFICILFNPVIFIRFITNTLVSPKTIFFATNIGSLKGLLKKDCKLQLK